MTSSTPPVHCLFQSQVPVCRGAVAVSLGERTITYEQLDAEANRLARLLRRLGVAPDAAVGLYADRSIELVICLLAILKAGGAFVPLDPSYPAERLAWMIEDASIRWVLSTSRCPEPLRETSARWICVEDVAASLREEDPGDPACEVRPEALAYILYTSGSTGRPKGVQIPHGALTNHMAWMQRELPLRASDRVLQKTPLSFDASIWEVFAPLLAGARLVLARPDGHKDTSYLVKTIREQGVTVAQFVPSLLSMFVEAEGARACTSLRRVFSGGEMLSVRLARRVAETLDAELINLYGPTEATIDATFHRFTGAEDGANVPVGKSIDHVLVHVLDERMRRAPHGAPGEVYIGGRGLARGYLNRDELTRARFVEVPGEGGAAERWFRTGDQGRILPDGSLEILGRLDDQVKLRGHRVELGEIEALLLQHPAVKEAAAAVKALAPHDERLFAYVVPASPATRPPSVEDQQIQQWRELWDEAYRQPGEGWATDFHIGGWNDSYTGKALPEEHIREWVDHTVERIRGLGPRRALEIGCGSGMLMFRLAPECERYVATDVSSEAIQYLADRLQGSDLSSRVTLQRAAAHEVSAIPGGPFDTIIINSVVAMFPGVDYLVRVLEQAMSLLSPGGVLFVGDVLSRPLLEAFHTSVELYRAADGMPTEALRALIRARIADERRLLLDPELFVAFGERSERPVEVQILLKRGALDNELTRFRYDAVLRLSRPDPSGDPVAPVQEWAGSAITASDACARLERDAPDAVRIRQVPNARLVAAAGAVELLGRADCPASAGELRRLIEETSRPGIEPEQWTALERRVPYAVTLTWSGDGAGGAYDVLMVRRGVRAASPRPSPGAQRSWAAYANTPMDSREALTALIHGHLSRWLPEHMRPSAILFVEELPRLAGGKLDRRALPLPAPRRSMLEEPEAPRDEQEAALAALWAETLGLDRVGIHDNFFELGGHSMLIMRLLARVRATQGVSLPLHRLFEAPTVAGMAAALRAERGGAPAPILDKMSVAALSAEVWLPDEVRGRPGPQRVAPEGVLLTGATGFLGAFLLAELLAREAGEIHCLVRAATAEHAMARIGGNLERYGLGDVWRDPESRRRIRPVCGDLARERLGLGEQAFEALAGQVGTIFHAGADVNILYPYAAVRAANVGGTRELMRLSSLGDLRCFVHISSTGVFESTGYAGLARPIREDDPLDGCADVIGGYCQSKWVAERLVMSAHERGIPVTVIRPGLIGCHSVSGACNVDDMLSRLIRAFIGSGIVPDLDIPIDITPVDYMSRAIIELAGRPAGGQIFHLVNPEPLRLPAIVGSLRKAGHPLQVIPYRRWLAEVEAQSDAAAARALGAMTPLLVGPIAGLGGTYLEMTSLGMTFACDAALRALHGTGIVCPRVNGALLRTFVDSLIAAGRGRTLR